MARGRRESIFFQGVRMTKFVPNGDAVIKGLIITAISLTIINYTKGMYPATVRSAMGV